MKRTDVYHSAIEASILAQVDRIIYLLDNPSPTLKRALDQLKPYAQRPRIYRLTRSPWFFLPVYVFWTFFAQRVGVGIA